MSTNLGDICCPSDTTYDPDSGYCVDQFGIQYDPISCPDTGSNPGTGNQPVNVTVNVNNAENIANDALNAIAGEVQDGITSAIDDANTIEQNSADEIATQIGNVVTQTNTAASNVVNGIGTTLNNLGQGILNNIGQFVSDLASSVKDAVSKIADAVSSLAPTVVNIVQSVSDEINNINNNIVQPITNTILSAIQNISALTSIIEKDLDSGIAGILKIPGDLAGGVGSIADTLNTTMQQLGLDVQTGINVNFSDGNGDTLYNRLASLTASMGVPSSKSNVAATFAANLKLSDPSFQNVLTQLLNVMVSDTNQLMHQMGLIGDSIIESLANNVSEDKTILNTLVTAGGWILLTALGFIGEFFPLMKFSSAQLQAQVPLEKLDIGTIARAYQRRFLDENQTSEEMGFAGFDSTRIQVLKDLTVYLIDIDKQIDMWFRGLVSDDDLATNLDQHGVVPGDVELLKQAAYRKISVELATTALKYGAIQPGDWLTYMQKSNVSVEEIAILENTMLLPEFMQDAMLRLRITQFWADMQFSPATLGTVPPDVLASGQAEGLAASVILDRWQQQFRIPPIEEMIQLYFRGVRTQQELYACMNYWMVPEQFRSDIIAARRPLIPFRTIPKMLAEGAISLAYAQQVLTGHGFSLVDTNILLTYAQDQAKTTKMAANGNPALMSLGVAKQLWFDDAITDQQYNQALVAHGYDQGEADIFQQVQNLQKAVLRRKEEAETLINYVLAGTTSMDEFNAAMAADGFTVAEQVKARNTIARLQRTNAKTPTEAELTKMVTAQAITFADWQTAMAVLGYAQKWIDAFAQLNFGSINGPQNVVTAS